MEKQNKKEEEVYIGVPPWPPLAILFYICIVAFLNSVLYSILGDYRSGLDSGDPFIIITVAFLGLLVLNYLDRHYIDPQKKAVILYKGWKRVIPFSEVERFEIIKKKFIVSHYTLWVQTKHRRIKILKTDLLKEILEAAKRLKEHTDIPLTEPDYKVYVRTYKPGKPKIIFRPFVTSVLQKCVVIFFILSGLFLIINSIIIKIIDIESLLLVKIYMALVGIINIPLLFSFVAIDTDKQALCFSRLSRYSLTKFFQKKDIPLNEITRFEYREVNTKGSKPDYDLYAIISLDKVRICRFRNRTTLDEKIEKIRKLTKLNVIGAL